MDFTTTFQQVVYNRDISQYTTDNATTSSLTNNNISRISLHPVASAVSSVLSYLHLGGFGAKIDEKPVEWNPFDDEDTIDGMETDQHPASFKAASDDRSDSMDENRLRKINVHVLTTSSHKFLQLQDNVDNIASENNVFSPLSALFPECQISVEVIDWSPTLPSKIPTATSSKLVQSISAVSATSPPDNVSVNVRLATAEAIPVVDISVLPIIDGVNNDMNDIDTTPNTPLTSGVVPTSTTSSVDVRFHNTMYCSSLFRSLGAPHVMMCYLADASFTASATADSNFAHQMADDGEVVSDDTLSWIAPIVGASQTQTPIFFVSANAVNSKVLENFASEMLQVFTDDLTINIDTDELKSRTKIPKMTLETRPLFPFTSVAENDNEKDKKENHNQNMTKSNAQMCLMGHVPTDWVCPKQL